MILDLYDEIKSSPVFWERSHNVGLSHDSEAIFPSLGCAVLNAVALIHQDNVRQTICTTTSARPPYGGERGR